MSAYAALVSLLRILGTMLDSDGLRIIQTKAQLQSLHEKVILVLNFLENSSTCKGSQISELETKIRMAAYNAEDILELQLSRILRFHRRRLAFDMQTALIYMVYAYYVVASSDTVVSFPVLASVAMSTMTAVYVHLAIQVYDRSGEMLGPERQESVALRRVLNDFNIIEEDVINIEAAHGDREMSGYDALVSLRQILDSILDSGGLRMSRNRAQLKSLHEKVCFLLDFLGNASTYMATQKSELQNLDAEIRDAVYKTKALIGYLVLPRRFSLDSAYSRRLYTLFKISLNASSPYLPLDATLINNLLTFMNYDLILASFPQDIPAWIQILVRFFLILALAFVPFVLWSSRAVVLGAVLAVKNNSEAALEIQELPLVIDDFSIIVRNAVQIKDACGNPSHLPSPAASAAVASSRLDLGGTGKYEVVGHESDRDQIKARLVQHSSKLEVISIVGMGGIGKTTLAKQVYNDPELFCHFDIRAWVTISQEYSLRHVLLGILDSGNMLGRQMQEDNNDERLGEDLFRYLKSRRFLIVMDDLWDTQIWDSISRFYPDDSNGSRVLLTSRLSDVASYPASGSPLHQMRCLNDTDSWYLLREKVFGGESCPLELESIGKEIARSCRGLPLAIVVIGGLLYKDRRSKIWRDVAENLYSGLRQTEEQCLEILSLSYYHLPHHLRPCFLYMGFFPGDCEIPVSRLISLWIAEGFLRPCTSKNVEEVAEDYLKDLIERHLILVCKRNCYGKIRTCSIHDLLRDVCVQNARKENFLHAVNRGGYITLESPNETPRRVSLRVDAQPLYTSHHFISCCGYYARSFLCNASKILYEFSPSDLYLGVGYLRVLDLAVVHFSEFPDQIVKLLHLRYLAFHYDSSLPPSMSKLQNLETIVHHHCSFRKYPLLPRVIWSMPNLRHLYVKPGCCLSDPFCYRLPRKSFILEHLQTLMGIRNFKWSKGIIKRIPNLKKLGIWYDVSSSVDWSAYQLESLVDLHQLETLKIIIKNNDLGFGISHDPPKLAFPQKLKKLTLSGCGIPWASMTMIGLLPNLEALKLRCEACSGPSWETVEGQFPQLTYLLLEQILFRCWETDADHFPRLQRLVMRSCGMLEEIPSGIGDIPTLEMIELVDCHPSAVDSAKQIQEEQESMGNVDLKVCIGL